MCFKKISYGIELNRQVKQAIKFDKYRQKMRHATHMNRLQNIYAGYSPEPKQLTFSDKLYKFLKKVTKKH